MSRRDDVRLSLSAAQRRAVANLVPEFADRLKLNEKNSRTVYFLREELLPLRRLVMAGQRTASGAVRNSLRHVAGAITMALNKSKGFSPFADAETLYQFKITLLDSRPSIWRRIQTRDCTLDKFHEHIQTAMGWTNSHLHAFEIDGERYGDPELMDDGFDDFECIDSTVSRISTIVPGDGRRFCFRYEYDFGDGWEHEVLFEGCLRANPEEGYPLCVEGERACPPEDVGGIWGFVEYLEALADPQHEEHVEMLRWRGPFDAEKFDSERATDEMRRGLPDWRNA